MQHRLYLHHGYSSNMFLPLYSFSAEEIFEGKILLFDVNFFNPRTQLKALTQTKDDDGNVTGENIYDISDGRDALDDALAANENESVKYYYYLEDPNGGDTDENRVITSQQNTALDLQKIVSQWYLAIRNIAIVLSMSVLLYIGIRMLLTSVAQDKAKYKQMLIDWVVGICLLFFLHYIMAFSVTIVETFNKIISQAGEESVNNQVVLLENDDDKYISDKLEEIGMESFVDDSTDPAQIVWPTNLMGMLRLKAQVSYGDAAFIGYGICYAILVLFTLYFIYVYLRRVLYMAFLTMIAPLVALTYPIDKISDSQAQGFNRWLKEYIFNLLLQPLHLLLYTILVTSAYELASTNVIYSLVAIAFLIPAEKLMRSLFGFEKASTPGSAAGAVAGATLLNTGLQKLLHKAPTGGKDSGNGGKSSGDGEDNSTPRMGFPGADNYVTAAPEDDNADSTRNLDAGGASAADAAQYNTEEDPRKRMEREALEEKIADGQIDESELSAEQRALLGKKAAEDEQDTIRQQNASQPSQNTQQTRRIIRRPSGKTKLTRQEQRAGMIEAGKLTAKQAGRKLKSVAPKAIRTAAKAGAGAAVGLTAGAVGATIGLATGDPSNVFTYGGAAALAGGALGASAINTNTPSRTKSAAQIARERAYWGDKYDQHIAEENMKDWKKDSDKRANIERYLGNDKTKELYNSGKINKYLQNEITSEKDIAALEQLQERQQMSFDDALLVYDAFDKYGNIEKQKPKDQSDILDGYTKRFKKGGFSDKGAKDKAEMVTGMTKILDGYKKNLH